MGSSRSLRLWGATFKIRPQSVCLRRHSQLMQQHQNSVPAVLPTATPQHHPQTLAQGRRGRCPHMKLGCRFFIVEGCYTYSKLQRLLNNNLPCIGLIGILFHLGNDISLVNIPPLWGKSNRFSSVLTTRPWMCARSGGPPTAAEAWNMFLPLPKFSEAIRITEQPFHFTMIR